MSRKNRRSEKAESVSVNESSTKQVPYTDFAKVYIEGCKNSLTASQMCEQLGGMKVKNFQQRAMALRKFCKENNREVLYPKSNRGRKVDLAGKLSILDSLLS